MSARLATALVGLLGLGMATCPTVSADRLHLAAGGSIDVERWRIEGDTLIYESAAGSVGVPRELVVRIETTTADPSPDVESAATSAPVTPPPAPVPTIRVAPEIAELMRRARAALDGRDYRLAADLYGEALRDGPDELQPARVGYALARLALGEDALAAGAVYDGLARDPTHPELLELLGDLRDREERVEDALAAWREARAARDGDDVPRLRRKIERAERELAAARDYSMSASSHFTLRHDGALDRSLTRSVLDHLEREFWRVTRELDHTPRRPITVQLFPEQAFREVTGADEWVGGLYDGKIRVPLGGLRRLTEPARRVLTHELAHAVLHSKTRGNCPRWLHEGLAQRAEPRRPAAGAHGSLVEQARAAEPARLLTDAHFSYPLALSLTTFAIDYWGESALLRLLDRLGDGRSLEDAMLEVYGETPSGFAARWAAETFERGGR